MADILALLDTLDGLGTKPGTDTNGAAYADAVLSAYPRLAQALRTALTPTTCGVRESPAGFQERAKASSARAV
jgi:hypothetical protein